MKVVAEHHNIIGNLPDFSRPVIFLDFDGVVNILGDEQRQAKGICKRKLYIPNSFSKDINYIRVYWDPKIVDALRDMNAVWLTSWNQLTQTKLNPLLGTDFGYVNWKYRGISDWGGHGKAHYLGQVVRATGCEWISLDDELAHLQDEIASEAGKDGLLITTNMNTGLTLEQLQIVQDFSGTLSNVPDTAYPTPDVETI